MTTDATRDALVRAASMAHDLAETAAQLVRDYDRRNDPVLPLPDEVAYREAEDELERRRAGL